MLKEFWTRYPRACLIGELLQIDHGKYIVRVSVQIEGVTVATGLAAAETVEAAEDRARIRALEIAQFHLISQPSSLTNIQESNSQKTETFSTPKTTISESKPPTELSSAIEDVLEEAEPIWESEEPELSLEPSETYSYTPEPERETPIYADPTLTLETEEIVASPPTPLKKPAKTAISNEATDYSDVIARTNVEMKRLGWTSEQGRDYLLGTYGKRSRQLLDDEQLLEFLQHLESLPTP